MKFAPFLFVALALAFTSCAASHDPVTSAFGGSAAGAGNLRGANLRDNPAVSSEATLPALRGPGSGSANAYYRGLGGGSSIQPSVAPSVTGGLEASPQAGVVTGDRVWP